MTSDLPHQHITSRSIYNSNVAEGLLCACIVKRLLENETKIHFESVLNKSILTLRGIIPLPKCIRRQIFISVNKHGLPSFTSFLCSFRPDCAVKVASHPGTLNGSAHVPHGVSLSRRLLCAHVPLRIFCILFKNCGAKHSYLLSVPCHPSMFMRYFCLKFRF